METKKLHSLLRNAKKLHFIGAGGISMSSLAVIAADRGYAVSGSDRADSEIIARMRKHGVDVYIGENSSLVEGADAVIYTAAVHADNPEFAHAVQLGIPTVRRAEFLGFIMQSYNGRIGVAGMHGKSTATSMISQIFITAGVDPTVVNGVELSCLGGAYRVGSTKHFIFEACEYTDSFLSFFPDIAVVLNVDRDHVDYFESMEQTIESFSKYMSLAKMAIINADDENTMAAARSYTGKAVTFGRRDGVDYRAADVRFERGMGSYDLYRYGEKLGRISLNVPGEHNITDSLAACAASLESGIAFDSLAEALPQFSGAHRRFEYKGCYGDIALYDDYAHHPSEIKTTLAAVKRLGYKKIYCIFQPHTYSRTAGLFNDFAHAFSDADEVIFADIYAARETDTMGVSAQKLADAAGEHAKYVGDFTQIADYIRKTAVPDSLVLTMGAGDVYKIADMLENK